MRKRYIKIQAICLITVFLLSISIKLLDGYFHHHLYVHYLPTSEQQFHQKYSKCPILAFEFSIFSKDDNAVLDLCLNDLTEYISNYIDNIYRDFLSFSFSLRGPPRFTKYGFISL